MLNVPYKQSLEVKLELVDQLSSRELRRHDAGAIVATMALTLGDARELAVALLKLSDVASDERVRAACAALVDPCPSADPALVAQLEAKGFYQWNTGGHCTALVRQRDGVTDVITSTDGADLPEANDWLLCTYRGDWVDSADCPQISQIDSENSPVDLITAVDLGGFPTA